MSEPTIKSGNPAIDGLFSICVEILLWLADLFGVSYNTINIWIFCIIWPIFTILLIAIVIKQYIKIQKLKKEIKSEQEDQADREKSSQ
jgi:uncharacterized membrane protein YcjF (UPF0283 family)